MEPTYPETTLRDYLKVLFRHKGVIITTFITVMATVAIGLQLKTPVYQARVKLLISAEKQVEATYYRDLIRSQSVEIVLTQSEIVKSNPVIERTVRALKLYQRPLDYEKRFCSGLKKPLINSNIKRFNQKLARLTEEQKKAFLFRRAVEDLKRSVKVEPIRDTNLFSISVREFSPVGAAIIANVVSRSYTTFDLEQQLSELELKYGEKHLSVKQLKDNIARMVKTLSGEPLSSIEAIGSASVKIIEQAQIPIKPVGPNKLLTIILALVMSPFLGIMLAFMFEYMDQTFKSPGDIETFLNIPFLGAIPRKKKLKKHALQNLSDQLYLLMSDKGLRVILLTSALPKEGTTTIICNLGRHLAQKMGHKALLIDANLRNPSMHKAFNIPQAPGLADVLEGNASFESVIASERPSPVIASERPSPVIARSEATKQSQEPKSSHLHILPAGRTELNPITLLSSSMMNEVINMARQKYEAVFIDCANLRDFKDAALLSSSLDGIAIVINEAKTRRQVVKAALVPLEQKKANILGVILNNRTFAIPGFVYNRV